MRLRKVKNADEIIAHSRYIINDGEKYKNNWGKVFQNNNPIHLEIGCGKGRYIYDLARTYENINFIGVEKFDNVIVRACQKLETSELKNICLLKIDALELSEIFGEAEIDTIYLNFSDPWPKERHEKRRLTSEQFLKIYQKILKNKLIMKTDNLNLFNYSIDSLENHGFKIIEKTNDLHSLNTNNIMTEYEERFSKKNIKINRLIAEYIKEGK